MIKLLISFDAEKRSINIDFDYPEKSEPSEKEIFASVLTYERIKNISYKFIHRVMNKTTKASLLSEVDKICRKIDDSYQVGFSLEDRISI